MFHWNKKLKAGYQKQNKKQQRKEKKDSWLSNLLVAPNKKIGILEKIIKLIIYVILRMVIKPSKWKDPKKNYQIINKAYSRITSSDFIYIPSSIAFYLIISFMPIFSIIMFLYSIPQMRNWLSLGQNNYDPINDILGKFIPGMDALLKNIRNVVHGNNYDIQAGAIVSTFLSLIISTWISSAGFAKLIYTESHIYKHKFTGGYWINKFKGISLVIYFTIFLFISLCLNILVGFAIRRSNLLNFWKEFIKMTFLIIGLFIMIFILLTFFYKFSPRFKIRFRDVIPGSTLTSVTISIFLTIIGSITSIWDYGSYGIMGVIMYIGMMSLVITYFIFLGLSVNASYYETFVNVKVKSKKQIFQNKFIK